MNKWNKTIHDAGHGKLNRLSALMGVEQAMSTDKDGDQEDRIWQSCNLLRPFITASMVNCWSGRSLDQAALCYDLERNGGEYDEALRIRIMSRKAQVEGGVSREAIDKRGPLNWYEGMHFVRDTGNAYIGEQLYRVMHPGQAGGQCAFVLRIDTGEESLFDKSSTDLREIKDKQELAERLQEASFSNLMNTYANGDITLAIAMQAARIILHDGTIS